MMDMSIYLPISTQTPMEAKDGKKKRDCRKGKAKPKEETPHERPKKAQETDENVAPNIADLRKKSATKTLQIFERRVRRVLSVPAVKGKCESGRDANSGCGSSSEEDGITGQACLMLLDSPEKDVSEGVRVKEKDPDTDCCLLISETPERSGDLAGGLAMGDGKSDENEGGGRAKAGKRLVMEEESHLPGEGGEEEARKGNSELVMMEGTQIMAVDEDRQSAVPHLSWLEVAQTMGGVMLLGASADGQWVRREVFEHVRNKAKSDLVQLEDELMTVILAMEASHNSSNNPEGERAISPQWDGAEMGGWVRREVLEKVKIKAKQDLVELESELFAVILSMEAEESTDVPATAATATTSSAPVLSRSQSLPSQRERRDLLGGSIADASHVSPTASHNSSNCSAAITRAYPVLCAEFENTAGHNGERGGRREGERDTSPVMMPSPGIGEGVSWMRSDAREGGREGTAIPTPRPTAHKLSSLTQSISDKKLQLDALDLDTRRRGMAVGGAVVSMPSPTVQKLTTLTQSISDKLDALDLGPRIEDAGGGWSVREETAARFMPSREMASSPEDIAQVYIRTRQLATQLTMSHTHIHTNTHAAPGDGVVARRSCTGRHSQKSVRHEIDHTPHTYTHMLP